MILGLDVSTSITGATLLDNENNIVFNEAWDTRKYKDFFDKAEFESFFFVRCNCLCRSCWYFFWC